MSNILLDVDSYKASHYLQYPPGTQYVSSYIEARKGDCVFFGLQAWIEKNLRKPIDYCNVLAAENFFKEHGVPFNRAGWDRILQEHRGFLPIQISAHDEGAPVPAGTPLVEIQNTDPELPWLTSYLETSLLRAIWYPSTVAKISRDIKIVIKDFLLQTTGSDEGLDFKLHDFGSRGVSSQESAGLGGAAHLINFKGTDTIEGIALLHKYYGAGVCGFSIPAAEHSTITAWGRDGESAAYGNMLAQFPEGLVAIVADSYDIYHAADCLLGQVLSDEIESRKGTVIIRPDSGHPYEVLPRLFEILEDRFGATINHLNYKVLPDYLRVIWGDGIDLTAIFNILHAMKGRGWAASNIAFGMGGALLQHCNRDTLGFAMKASAIDKGQGWEGISKDPVTDPSKKSKTGVQATPCLIYEHRNGYLQFYRHTNLEIIRSNAAV